MNDVMINFVFVAVNDWWWCCASSVYNDGQYLRITGTSHSCTRARLYSKLVQNQSIQTSGKLTIIKCKCSFFQFIKRIFELFIPRPRYEAT